MSSATLEVSLYYPIKLGGLGGSRWVMRSNRILEIREILEFSSQEIRDGSIELRAAYNGPSEEIAEGTLVTYGQIEGKPEECAFGEVIHSEQTYLAQQRLNTVVKIKMWSNSQAEEVLRELNYLEPKEDTSEVAILAGRFVRPDTRPNHQSMLWER